MCPDDPLNAHPLARLRDAVDAAGRELHRLAGDDPRVVDAIVDLHQAFAGVRETRLADCVPSRN